MPRHHAATWRMASLDDSPGSPSPPATGTRLRDIVLGLGFAGLLLCIVAAERFDLALSTRAVVSASADVAGAAENAAAGSATGDTADSKARVVDEFAIWWSVTAAVGLALAGISFVLLRRHTRAHMRAQEDEPLRQAYPGARRAALDDPARALAIFQWYGSAAIILWAFWQATGVGLAFADATPELLRTFRSIAHLLAIVAAVVAVGSASHVLRDAALGWRETSVVRIQLIVLAAVFALVFLVPITSGQVTDVLRAWGDRAGVGVDADIRWAVGVAAALLLGAVTRASATRILTPAQRSSFWPTTSESGIGRSGRLFAAALLLLALAACKLGLHVALGVLVAIALLAWITEWTSPPDEDQLAGKPEGLRRLPGVLAVVPLAIVFAGLVSAATDSLLLPEEVTTSDLNLLKLVALVGVLVGIQAGFANPRASGGSAGPAPRRAIAASVAFGVGGFLAALAPGAARALGAATDFVEGVDLAAGVVLLLGAAALALPIASRVSGAPPLWAGAGVALGMAGSVYCAPVAAPRAFGTLGIAFIGATAALLVFHLAGTIGTRRRFVRGRRWLPKRVPVVTLVFVWLIAAASFTRDEVHQARTITAHTAPTPLGAEVKRWLDASWRARDSDQKRPYMPMLLVAASGGGSKAAYWTDLVLDCLFGDGEPIKPGGEEIKQRERECPPSPEGPARYRRLFMTSSVSGGSVGIHHFLRSGVPRGAGDGPWVDRTAGRDVLSPTVAWGLFHDLPVVLLGAKTDPRDCDDAASCRLHADRALVQEAAVAGRVGIVPPPRGGLLPTRRAMRSDRAKRVFRPLTIFNGALDGADGRALISRAHLAPPRLSDPGCQTPWTGEPAAGSIDAHDLLNRQKYATKSRARGGGERRLRQKAYEADHDLPLITAALLSARFPLIAPAGRLGDGEPLKRCVPAGETLPAQRIRDGGYVENSGVLTIVELLPAIIRTVAKWKENHKSAVIPFIVVSIDDDPAVTDRDTVLVENRRERFGIAKNVGKAYLTRQARDRLESCQYRGVVYRRLSPPPHPGATAATGWEISETVRTQDLGAAVRQRSDTLNKLRAMLTGTRRAAECPP